MTIIIEGGTGGETMVPTPGLVPDGATDNYPVIMNTLAEDGVVVFPPVSLHDYAVSAPILLASGMGLVGYMQDTPGSAASSLSSRIIPTGGFSGALSPAQQTLYPALGATASAPIVHAGSETYLRGIRASGLNIAASAAILGASPQVSWIGVGMQAGTGTTVQDIGSSQQGTWSHVTIRGNGQNLALDLESFDWLIDNLRVTAGSKILNCGGAMISVCHFTGSDTAHTFNTQFQAGMSVNGIQFDSGGAVTDLVNINLGATNFPVQLSNVTIVNNSGSDIPNIFNNSSGKAALVLNGLTCADFGTHKWGALLANAALGDRVMGVSLNSNTLDAPANLGSLFPNGTPDVYDVVTF